MSDTRILVFLKPSKSGTHRWDVAGYGNCYFWSNNPEELQGLRKMAKSAIDVRTSWEAAHSLTDRRQRAEALWPFLWNYNLSCYSQTKAALQESGAVAGD